MIAKVALVATLVAFGASTLVLPAAGATVDSGQSPVVAGLDGSQFSQQTNATTCQPGASEPNAQQADLHTSDEVIDQGSPGRISGTFVMDIANECPVRVQITLNVPNNMYIEGGGDIQSGGGGAITTTHVVDPGEAWDISAEVYGTETGEHSVSADITYFPVGHQDMAREIDGLMLTFDIQEPTSPGTETATGGGNSGPGLFEGVTTVQWLLGIVTITVVGLLITTAMGINTPDEIKAIFNQK